MKAIQILMAISCIAGASAAIAQTTSVTQAAPAPFQAKAGPVVFAPSVTNLYSKPGRGADGPIPGTQRGSSTETSYEVTATMPMPEIGKKKTTSVSTSSARAKPSGVPPK